MIDVSYWLWENYPLSKWLIEVIVSFVLAEDLPFRSPNKQIKEILWNFWYDPVNRMDLYIDKYVRELFLYGELCLPMKVSKNTGIVRLGYIDPKQIEFVHTDPENVRIVIGITLKARVGEKAKQYKTVLNKDLSDFVSNAGVKLRDSFTDGECFFFAINNVTNSPRGRGVLLPVADWIDVYENFLYDYAEKWSQQNSFVWDLTCKNTDAAGVETQVKNFMRSAYNPGSVYGHNDVVELKALAPDLKSLDVDMGARIFRNHILGCLGFPAHWYGGGEDVNRASATEMAIPTMKILSGRQKYFKHILESFFDYQLDVAIQYNRITYQTLLKKDMKYEVLVPELAVRDLSKFGAVIKNIADGLAVAEDRQWIDPQTAMEVLSVSLGFMGKELDVLDILERFKTNPPRAKGVPGK